MTHCRFSVLIICFCYPVILGILENCTHTKNNLVTLKSLPNMRNNSFFNVMCFFFKVSRAAEFSGMNLSILFFDQIWYLIVSNKTVLLSHK